MMREGKTGEKRKGYDVQILYPGSCPSPRRDGILKSIMVLTR